MWVYQQGRDNRLISTIHTNEQKSSKTGNNVCISLFQPRWNTYHAVELIVNMGCRFVWNVNQNFKKRREFPVCMWMPLDFFIKVSKRSNGIGIFKQTAAVHVNNFIVWHEDKCEIIKSILFIATTSEYKKLIHHGVVSGDRFKTFLKRGCHTCPKQIQKIL